MSKEQTPITVEYQSILKSKIEYYGDTEAAREFAAEQYAKAKVLEVQNNLIADIKEKVAKLEENTNTTDFVFDVINLLKSIRPLENNEDGL